MRLSFSYVSSFIPASTNLTPACNTPSPRGATKGAEPAGQTGSSSVWPPGVSDPHVGGGPEPSRSNTRDLRRSYAHCTIYVSMFFRRFYSLHRHKTHPPHAAAVTLTFAPLFRLDNTTPPTSATSGIRYRFFSPLTGISNGPLREQQTISSSHTFML